MSLLFGFAIVDLARLSRSSARSFEDIRSVHVIRERADEFSFHSCFELDYFSFCSAVGATS